jgi:four helix bundle protein
MAGVKNFEGLEVWRKARDLGVHIYQATQSGGFARDFGLRDQLRRASVSIISNIAEGFERGSNREFIHFLHMAKGSAGEVRAQLYLALDLKYLDQNQFHSLTEKATAISCQMASFIKYLETCKTASRTNIAGKT